MAIKDLDQDTITSIYNKFIFSAKPEVNVLDKNSVISISNNLTSIQNAFNVLSASIYNIGKLNEFKLKRQEQLTREKTIEGSNRQTNSIGGASSNLNVTVQGLGILSKYFEDINDKLEKLDLSKSAADGDVDIDIKRGRRSRSRGRARLGRGMKVGAGALGVLGVGLDVADRVSEGQGLLQTAVGVGGGLAGAAGGAKLGSTLGAFGGPVGAAAGGLIGGLGGYFAGSFLADKGYEAVSKAQLSETSYSSRFADFIRNSIISVVSAFPALTGAAILGGTIFNRIVGSDNGGELPPNAGVLDAIAKAEGTYGANGYNTSLANGAYLPGGREQNLTGKTLDEILQLQKYMLNNPQNRFNSSALGRYQIVSTTLRDAAAALNLDTRTTKFDEETQDRMAMWILKKQGFGAWEGFKRSPQLLQIAQTALQEGRMKAPMLTGSGAFGSPTSNSRLTSAFGSRPGAPGYASKNHKGLDFGARTPGVSGDPIYASSSGQVTSYTGSRGSYGNIVEIDHGNGYRTRYAHLSSINVAVGQTVGAGQVIGLMGSTGNSEYPVHLHFEILKDGTQINPAPLLGAVGPTGEAPQKAGNIEKPQIYNGPLLDPKKKKKPKVIIVEKPVYKTLQEARLKGPGQQTQPPRQSGNKSLNYYVN